MSARLDPKHDLAIPFAPVAELLRRYKARDAGKTALVDLDQNGKSITWGQLHEEANRIARWLAGLGVKPGDKVGLLSDETLEKLILWLGIWRLGAVVCPLNVEMNKTHVRELLGNIGPTLTLWHKELDGAAMTEGVPGRVMRFDAWPASAGATAGKPAEAPTGAKVGKPAAPDAQDAFAEIARIAPAPEVTHEVRSGDLSAIFCTSGTTSRPKCVVYDHMAYWLSGLSTLDMLGLGPEDKTLEYRSFGWNSAQILSFMPWLQTGLTLHIARRFSHSRFFDWIRRHGITFAAGVPTVVNMLLNEPLGVTAADVPTLRLMTCSTAPLSPEQWERFETMYGLTLLQLYGMSEAGWICGNRHYRRRMGTVGPPAKHQEFIIVDGEGKPCPPGIEGEVSVGGPQTCLGTISPEGVFERTRETRMKTGDLAVMDDDGFVRVTGRTKDLIIRGGVNIAPLEIDNVLLKNPKVLEAASVGVPDKIYGEEIVAYIVAKPGEALSAADVTDHCRTLLPPYKVPKAVRLVEGIPKSDRGKVRRDALKALWLEEQQAKG